MRMRKVYGESKNETCPFCDKRAITENPQGIPVCLNHKKNYLDLKCVCGEWLDIKKSKFGAFCTCINCGAISLTKALSMNPKATTQLATTQSNSSKKQVKYKESNENKESNKKNVVVTSDEVDFMY